MVFERCEEVISDNDICCNIHDLVIKDTLFDSIDLSKFPSLKRLHIEYYSKPQKRLGIIKGVNENLSFSCTIRNSGQLKRINIDYFYSAKRKRSLR